jgi:hypothetical protein
MTIDDFVSDLLRRCHIPCEPPIDLVRLARALGVDEIAEASLVEDGRLEHTPYYVKVLLQRDAGYHRQRFTLAHELGHVVLTDPDAFVVARRYRPRADQEERFCDSFAAALLLPRTWVLGRYATAPRSLRVVRAMSDTAHVSLAASAIRLNELLGWQRTLLRWRRSPDGSWQLASTTGIPYRLHGLLRSAPETSTWLQSLARRGHQCDYAEIPLVVEGRQRFVRGDVAFLGGSAVALADLGT